MTNPGEGDLLSMADVARLAGQSRATVGNWKKRYPDFPSERSRNPRGPLYDRSEIVEWLGEHMAAAPQPRGRRRIGDQLPELWAILDSLRGELPAADAVLALLFTLAEAAYPDEALIDEASAREELLADLESLDVGLSERVIAALTLLPEEVFLFAMDTANRSGQAVEVSNRLIEMLAELEGIRSGTLSTPPSVATLLARLVGGRAGDVYDPCAGTGQVVAQIANNRPDVNLHVQDINPIAAGICFLNLRIQRLVAEVRVADSLRNDAYPELSADVVVLTPPWRVRFDDSEDFVDDPRWVFGEPSRIDADLAWAQIGLHHLSDDGRMVILAPPSLLFASGNSGRILQRIIKADLLDAVITLPPRLLVETNLTGIVLIFDRGRSQRWGGRGPGPVLLIDGDRLGEVERSGRSVRLTDDSIDRIAAAYLEWADGETLVHTTPREGSTEVTFAELAENGFALDPKRYEPPATTESIDDLLLERARVVAALDAAMAELNSSYTQFREPAPERLKPAAVRWVPIGEIPGVELIRGVNPSATNPDTGLPVLSVHAAQLGAEPRSYWEPDGSVDYSQHMLLVSLSDPSLGRTTWSSPAFVPDHNVVGVRVDENSPLDLDFLGEWVETPSFLGEMSRLARGSSFRRVTFREFAELKIPLPEKDDQQVTASYSSEAGQLGYDVNAVSALTTELYSLESRILAAQFQL